MSLKKSFLFGLILLAVLSFIYFYEMPEEQRRQDSKLLFGSTPEQVVSKIEVVGESGTFALQKRELPFQTEGMRGRWGFSDHKDVFIEESSLEAFFSALSNIRRDYLIPEAEREADLKVYGLDEPELELKIVRDGKEDSVKFGTLNDYIKKRYILVNNRLLYLIRDDLYQVLKGGKDYFWDKTPVEIDDADVSEISLISPDKHFEFKSAPGGRWSIEKPIKAAADNQEVGKLTRTLRMLKAASYLEKDRGPFAAENYKQTVAVLKNKPDLKAVIRFKNSLRKKPLTIIFGHSDIYSDDEETGEPELVRQENYFKIAGSAIYIVRGDPVPAMIRSIDQYRVRQPFTFDVDQVFKLVIDRTGEEKIEVTKAKSGAFTVSGFEGDAVFISKLLKDLTAVEIESFPKESRDFGFTSPRLSVDVFLKGLKGNIRKNKLVVGAKADAGGYYAEVSWGEGPFIISRETFRKINVRKEVLTKTD